MIGGPITYAAQPNAVTVATAVPGCSPGSRPAALNTAGTTDANPKPRHPKPTMAAGVRRIGRVVGLYRPAPRFA